MTGALCWRKCSQPLGFKADSFRQPGRSFVVSICEVVDLDGCSRRVWVCCLTDRVAVFRTLDDAKRACENEEASLLAAPEVWR